MSSLEPVGKTTRHQSEPQVENTATRILRAVVRAARQLPDQIRKDAAAVLNFRADQLVTIASSKEKTAGFIQSTRRIRNPKTRDANIESAGFDQDTARGLGLRVANDYPVFKNDRAVMHNRLPLSIAEAQDTLLGSALKFRTLAQLFQGQSVEEMRLDARLLSQIVQYTTLTATAGWDGYSQFAGVSRGASMLGSIVLATASEIENNQIWEREKMLALVGVSTQADLEKGRAHRNTVYACNRISVILSTIPFSGTVVNALSFFAGDGQAPADGEPSLGQLLDEAAAGDR